MRTNIAPMRLLSLLSLSLILITSCQKTDTAGSTTDDASTIAVAAAADPATSTTATDSVYLVQACGRGEKRDSIAQSALPAGVATYLTANYSGYTFSKAFAVKNSAATVTGYIVVIYYNNKPVGLKFDSTGAFVKVLEQREKGDLKGQGHHHGGRFEHRDGRQRDTVALSSLSTTIKAYLSANYPSDTLLKAFKNKDNGIVVLSKNNEVFATVFDANGAFVKRDQLQSRHGRCQQIELSALPSIAANYLALTYPNYVFHKAFTITENNTVKGYVVFIDANNTKYAVEFDASGNFVKAKTVL